MARLRAFKNNFTAGEIAAELLGRPDLSAYANGAAKLRNVLIRPTGGVTRRPGLRHVAMLPDSEDEGARLVTFRFNTEQTYLLLFIEGEIRVFHQETLAAIVAAPWSADQVRQLSWVQSADTLFICHPDIPPQRLTRTAHDNWDIAGFAFKIEDGSGIKRVPSFKFAKEDVTLTPSSTSGTITLTASEDLFTDAHIGTRFRIKKKEVEITGISSATQATATTKESLVDAASTRDWEEQAFSDHRGWPVAVTLFQERLIFAGSRDLPNRVWMSKTSDITNFNLGTALDDESIEFSLLTDQVEAIRAVVAGRHLQLFTAGAEWMITGEPLTPAKLRVDRQTRIGSQIERSIPPCHVDGATMFIARDGRGLRQFLYTDLDQAYSAEDMALLVPHLFNDPRGMDYDATRKLILLPMGDGSLAVQTNFRSQQILAWTRLQTDGAFRAVAVLNDSIYVLVQRQNGLHLECLDEACFCDAAWRGSSNDPKTVWGGLEHLEGRSVRVRADGIDRGSYGIVDGMLSLASAASSIEVGLPFKHEIEPLPAEIGGDAIAQSGPVRLIRAVFRLQDTAALLVDMGNGPRALAFTRFGETGALDAAPVPFTGDREMRGLGWVRGVDKPLWRIDQAAPQPFTLLSVYTELKGTE